MEKNLLVGLSVIKIPPELNVLLAMYIIFSKLHLNMRVHGAHCRHKWLSGPRHFRSNNIFSTDRIPLQVRTGLPYETHFALSPVTVTLKTVSCIYIPIPEFQD